jgi:hypothetical protein
MKATRGYKKERDREMTEMKKEPYNLRKGGRRGRNIQIRSNTEMKK